ncbi:MAG: calcium/sodium antiporter [Maricaulis sp.]|uniref:calcium/sodium antiporter n=1 Tax=Maricaulis sp. TaxID=1486257 RepID=UPI001B1FA12D|nr:calcium/sodium antiporter [Maricaulis sp.]MBO6729430.1 calcium/sodium antiporter [Maricaulis sp.]MBO6847461.1 calcium/sodium antiporter [Maricaulis sp.]MBO6877031.1 calcium/sodium antiporter [Maricaulis sp.]MDM7985605.1 calcium/sodium antiporter [Maricaulis sp.]
MSAPVFIALILGGIVVLLFGGDFLVRGGAGLARRWKLPSLFVGLTIVAFGTSAPELVVSVQSALAGAPGLAMGNIVGSNIANFLLVLGLPAVFGAIATTTPGVRRNAIFALVAAIALIGVGYDHQITPVEGYGLFATIIAYVLILGFLARGKTDDPSLAELTDIDGIEGLPHKWSGILFSLAVGLIALPVGAQMIVVGGTEAARALDIDESIIGLTALAFGTSLPELATVVMASIRRQADLAIGNVLGSNIFNVFAVGGATGIAAGAVGAELPVPDGFFALDFWVMLAASIVIAGIVLARRPIGRFLGLLLFVAYVGYIAVLAQSIL